MGVAVDHDDAGVGRDAATCTALFDVAGVVGAKAAPTEHYEQFARVLVHIFTVPYLGVHPSD